MPTRLLREAILDSERVCSLSFPAEVFYRRLMSAVDDFGRFDARSGVLRGRLYPLQIDKVREADIERWIAECVKAGLIALYSVSGKQYGLFFNLGEPRATKSKYPAPPECLDSNTHLQASVNGCAQVKTDANGREQTRADVPYSSSDAGSSSDSNSGAGGPPPEIVIPKELDSSEFRSAWLGWKAERRTKGKKPYTERGEKGQLSSLAKIGLKSALDAIDYSIRNGYDGLFPERFEHGTTGKNAGSSATTARGGYRVEGAPGDFDDCPPSIVGGDSAPAD